MTMNVDGLVVAVAGATGAVGREMLRTLAEVDFPIAELRALASARSVGRMLPFRDTEVSVAELTADAFAGVDVALFSAGGSRSLEFGPAAVKHGAVVIDNSSAFRMDEGVPLVVPEVNFEACRAHRGIIANPNCSTIQMVLPLKVLADEPGLERVVVTTYQSASGAGQSGVDELLAGTRQLLSGEEPAHQTFVHPLPFEVLPHIGTFEASGYTTEELKMTHETRKILGLPRLAVSATCARVPVLRGHSEAVTVDLAGEVDLAALRRRLDAFEGLVVVDEPERNRYPLARHSEGKPETFVGRLRRDLDRPRTLHFWVVSDNLLKGAATNAVQIAQRMVDAGLLPGSHGR